MRAMRTKKSLVQGGGRGVSRRTAGRGCGRCGRPWPAGSARWWRTGVRRGTRSATVMPSASSWAALSGLLLSRSIRSAPTARSICAAARVVALVLAVPERQVRLVGVEAGVLQRVRVELGVEADAPALLAQVEQEAAGVGDPLDRLAQLGPAVAPLGPKTSPVRHSLCGRTRGASPPRRSARAPAASRRGRAARCSLPSVSPSKVKTSAVVRIRRRTAAARSPASGRRAPRSVRRPREGRAASWRRLRSIACRFNFPGEPYPRTVVASTIWMGRCAHGRAMAG